MAALLITLLVVVIVGGLSLLRLRDRRFVTALRHTLSTPRSEEPALRFNAAMTKSLPPLVGRYLQSAIAAHAPIASGVALVLEGALRPQHKGDWISFKGREVVRSRTGFIWQMRGFKGTLPLFSGYEAFGPDLRAPQRCREQSRFWFFDLIPMDRAASQGDATVAIERLILSHLWLPSTLLPIDPIEWRVKSDHAIAYTLTIEGVSLEVSLTLDDQHRPIAIQADRHHNGTIVSYGGHFSAYGGFDGYHIPTEMTLGWGFGTADFTPTLKARILSARYIQ